MVLVLSHANMESLLHTSVGQEAVKGPGTQPDAGREMKGQLMLQILILELEWFKQSLHNFQLLSMEISIAMNMNTYMEYFLHSPLELP